jgi:DNA-binding SARP family transcriptional activator/predicted ATPase
MDHFLINLLGRFQINTVGQLEDPDLYIKTKALFAYLVVESGKIHPREKLASLFWSNKSTATAFINLRQSLSQLHKNTPSFYDLLNITPQSIQFIGQDSVVDSTYFRHLVDTTNNHSHTARNDCAYCIGLLEDAWHLYKGSLLSDIFLKECSEFDDWLLIQRQNFERLFINSLADLGDYYLKQGRFDFCEAIALRQIEIDPYREIAYRQYMRALDGCGLRTTAVQYYEKLQALLENDLGIKPEAETTLLYDQIRLSGQINSDFIYEKTPPSSFRDNNVFIGRKKEFFHLNSELRKVLQGLGRVVFIAGEAGWGKTALIEAFTQQMVESNPNIVIASGKCKAYTGIGDPYLPFRDILNFLVGDIETYQSVETISKKRLNLIKRLVPEIIKIILEDGVDLIDIFVTYQVLRQQVEELFPEGQSNNPNWVNKLYLLLERKKAEFSSSIPISQRNLFTQYSRVLQKISEKIPLILVLDDLQWMDAGSTSLFFHLGKSLRNSRILIIGAYRPSDLRLNFGHQTEILTFADNRGGGIDFEPNFKHPLVNVINEFKRDGGNIEIELSHCEDGFVDALIDTAPNYLDRFFRLTFQNRTQGHPLFSVELLDNLITSGGLIRDPSGYLVVGKALNWDVLPARVEAVIAEHMGRLPKHLLKILKTACVEGEVFTAEILAHVLEMNEDQVICLLSDEIGKDYHLIRAEGIRWQQGGQRICRYRFEHILFQKYLYSSIDPVECAYWHEKIGSALENLFQNTLAENAVSLSWHFEKAKDFIKAVNYLNIAGEKAARVSANQEAVAHFTQALSLLDELQDSIEKNQQELIVQNNLAVVLLATQGYADSGCEKAFRRAKELCEKIGDNSRIFPILWQLACHRVSCGDFKIGGPIMLDLIRTGEEAKNQLWISLGHWGKGWHDCLAGDYISSLKYLQVMLDFYDPKIHHRLAYEYSQDPGVACLAVLAFDLLAVGYLEQAVENCYKAIDLARQVDHPFSLAFALAYIILIFGFLGEVQPLRDFSDELVDLTQKYGFIYWYTAGLFGQGWALSLEKEIEHAVQVLSEARNIETSLGVQIQQELYGFSLAEALIKNGNVEEAIGLINQTIEKAQQTGEKLIFSELVRIKGEAFLILSPQQPGLAETLFLESIGLAQKDGAKYFELRSSLSLAHLWQKTGKYDQAFSMLSAIYIKFNEGLNRPILQEARHLLLELEGR